MDRVRFGRALGGGARDAARAILKAADAAAAPAPTPTQAQPPNPSPVPNPSSRPAAIPSPARLAQGTRRFGQAVWSPLARQSGVLWLEFTGVFFGLFALTAGLAAFRHRHDILAANPARPQALFALVMFLVFTWFTVSSFIKASRRSRASS